MRYALESAARDITTLRGVRDAHAAEIEALRAKAAEHRDGRLAALERVERLAEALRELVEVFSASGMYDEEVFDKARAALAKENSND